MPTVIVDANVLLRFVDPTAAQHPVAVAALDTLRTHGYSLGTVPQTLYEFWVVATRPVAANGLGLSPTEAARVSADLLVAFPNRADPPTLLTQWLTLVAVYGCVGKPAHDVRYVAALQAHALTHLLTFNGRDFTRYSGITVLDPANLAAPPAAP